MKQNELEELLLVEAHREIAAAARDVISKLGKPVPQEARENYLTEQDLASLRAAPLDFSQPGWKKSMAASAARANVLSYPPDGIISNADAEALESLQLTDAQKVVLERIVAGACLSAFFHFLCLLDSVADPVVTPVKHWPGARLVYRRKEGPMLHDKLYEAFTTLRNRSPG